MQADIVLEALRKRSDFYAHGQPPNLLAGNAADRGVASAGAALLAGLLLGGVCVTPEKRCE